MIKMQSSDRNQLEKEFDQIIEIAETARKTLSKEGISADSLPENLNEIIRRVNDIEKEIPGCTPALIEAERLTDEILDVILNLAALDFTKTVRVGYEDSNYNAVAAGLNMLGQELQRSTVSKAYVDNILSSMNDALIVINPDKTLKTVNEFARNLLGYAEGDLVGKNASILFEKEPLFLQGTTVDVPRGSGDRQADVVFRTQDNKLIPMQVKGSIMLDPTGSPAGIVLVARDMREIYRLIASAEAAAQSERERSNELLEAQKIIEAANLRLSDANTSLEKEIHNRKLAEHKLQEAHDSLELQVKERTSDLSKANELLNLEIEERKRAEAETRAREKKYRDIFENTSVSVWETDVTEALSVLKNLGLSSEAELTKFLENDVSVARRAVDAIKIVDINAASLTLFESQDKEVLLKNFAQIFQQGAFQKFVEALTAFTFGRELYEGEAEFLTLEGKKKTLHVLISLQHKAEDGTYTTLINLIDISHQRELEDQLRQSQKMEAIGRLAGGVAHDFNNLLTVILNYGQMLMDEVPQTGPMHKQIEQIVECAERAAALTQQLLAFSRKQVVAPKILDLNQSITKLDKMLRRLVGEDIEIINNLDPDIGLVKADVSQVEQIILNLAVNSRDAMPKGGKLIIETRNMDIDEAYLSYHPSIDPGKYVVVSITDSGEGMSEQVRSKIFEPFFTTKGLGKGTGLGLSTVYGNIKQSGGHIWVYSELGIGTTFKLFFPRLEENDQTKSTQEPKIAPLPTGSETILVVEDEDHVREAVCKSLRKIGYTVIEAKNGGEALLLSEQHAEKIDLLLTDVIMPKMNGRILAERLAKERANLKILFMSGYTDSVIAQNGILKMGTHLLQKPFTESSLAVKIRESLDFKTPRAHS